MHRGQHCTGVRNPVHLKIEKIVILLSFLFAFWGTNSAKTDSLLIRYSVWCVKGHTIDNNQNAIDLTKYPFEISVLNDVYTQKYIILLLRIKAPIIETHKHVRLIFIHIGDMQV